MNQTLSLFGINNQRADICTNVCLVHLRQLFMNVPVNHECVDFSIIRLMSCKVYTYSRTPCNGQCGEDYKLTLNFSCRITIWAYGRGGSRVSDALGKISWMRLLLLTAV